MTDGCSTELVELALRFAAIPASSASSERVWSALRNTQTKKRNRLSVEKLFKLGRVYFNSRVMKRRNVPVVNRSAGDIMSSDEEESSDDETEGTSGDEVIDAE